MYLTHSVVYWGFVFLLWLSAHHHALYDIFAAHRTLSFIAVFFHCHLPYIPSRLRFFTAIIDDSTNFTGTHILAQNNL